MIALGLRHNREKNDTRRLPQGCLIPNTERIQQFIKSTDRAGDDRIEEDQAFWLGINEKSRGK